MELRDLNYEKQVYTALLGKVIGVYLGGPFEGWSKERIQEKWGAITRYVHEDCGVPLVVEDDDISGTLTFVRALSESGAYAETTGEFFGKNWLNFLIPFKTILWWGGMSHSTEHTAYIRLTQGHSSPESGSMALNGREVSEQIGAQIFIDCYGMVVPGNPREAARLAGMSARVSHDGEAVYGAQVMAAMVSLAFTVKDIDAVLDGAIEVIPQDSLIAQVHRDVRQWCRENSDWNDTFARINERYGYSRYGGNCHVVPNHAVMVMAWSYGHNDFFKTMSIVATAGWDTDCNAGNVGSVSALIAGLEHLGDTYDFHTPFADRLIIPTADGTRTYTDVLEQALSVASIGRKIMGWEPLKAPKHGARYHFEMQEALQGFMPKTGTPAGNVRVRNIVAPEGFAGTRCLEVQFRNCGAIETPLACEPDCTNISQKNFTPAIYDGNTVAMHGRLAKADSSVRLYLRLASGEIVTSENAIPQNIQGDFVLSWNAQFHGIAIALGVECADEGTLWIDSIGIGGRAHFNAEESGLDMGWISSASQLRPWSFSNDSHNGYRYIISNSEPAVLVTGNRTWGDVLLDVEFKIHAADRAGVIFNYQGLQRWNGVIFTRDRVQLVRNLYGEEILAEAPFAYEENRPMQLGIRHQGNTISVLLDGQELFTQEEPRLTCGGAGLFAQCGLCGFGQFTADATTISG